MTTVWRIAPEAAIASRVQDLATKEMRPVANMLKVRRRGTVRAPDCGEQANTNTQRRPRQPCCCDPRRRPGSKMKVFNVPNVLLALNHPDPAVRRDRAAVLDELVEGDFKVELTFDLDRFTGLKDTLPPIKVETAVA